MDLAETMDGAADLTAEEVVDRVADLTAEDLTAEEVRYIYNKLQILILFFLPQYIIN